MNVPEGMTPYKLREIAGWLDTYDKMAESYLMHIEHSGWASSEDLAEARLTIDSDEVQAELRAWANQIEAQV